jgi:GYF domain 2/Protein of unknown function (DUF2569)
MSELWYYAEGDEPRGPLSFAELVRILSRMPDPRKVLVWRNGFEEWEAAETVRELAEQLFRPPPLRPNAPAIHSAEGPRTREPAVTAQKAAAVKSVKLAGIGGWLVLVAIAQVLGVLWVLLLTVGSWLYLEIDPQLFLKFPVMMWSGTAMNAGVLALVIYTTILLFKKSRKFPRFFVYEWLLLVSLPTVIIMRTSVSIGQFMILEPKDIDAAIWIAYIKNSRRVANTFIR